MSAITSAIKPRGAIWTVLGIPKHDWLQALENSNFFSKSYLAARDEIDRRRLGTSLQKAWGAEYEANEREARGFLTESGSQFFVARDDEGHAFQFMPKYWEAALAASHPIQTNAQP